MILAQTQVILNPSELVFPTGSIRKVLQYLFDVLDQARLARIYASTSNHIQDILIVAKHGEFSAQSKEFCHFTDSKKIY